MDGWMDGWLDKMCLNFTFAQVKAYGDQYSSEVTCTYSTG